MKFRGGPAAVIGDTDHRGFSKARPLAVFRREGVVLWLIRKPEDLLDMVHLGAKSDGKGFGDGDCAPLPKAPINGSRPMTKTEDVTKQQPKTRPAIIATRKTCDAEGTGLSHYVLMDKQVKR